jgi:hypothetical protein
MKIINSRKLRLKEKNEKKNITIKSEETLSSVILARMLD